MKLYRCHRVFGPIPILAVILLLSICNPASEANARSWVPRSLKPVHAWLIAQQDQTTGLLPSQQDDIASTYNNAMAVMSLVLHGEIARARRILDFYNERCNDLEFFVGGEPRGFFQFRSSTTGLPTPGSNRWMGDNAWLAMAIHHFEKVTGSTDYSPMASAIIDLLLSLQQPAGYVASGWIKDDSQLDLSGAAEGNLDAHKALALYARNAEAGRVKDWLDRTDLGWKATFLDLHPWRVLALGTGYGFSLLDLEPFQCTIQFAGKDVQGFLPFCKDDSKVACQLPPDGVQPLACNVWSEGTGQMAVSYFRAGYPDKGTFYVKQLRSLQFEPQAFPGTKTIAYFAHPEPQEHNWADCAKGHLAGVCWTIFAEHRFDPFAGEVIGRTKPSGPICRIEAENFESSSARGLRSDTRSIVSEGKAVHLAGDNSVSDDESGVAIYAFNVPANLRNVSLVVRYADDVGGDTCSILIDGVPVAQFVTLDTGTWDDYLTVRVSTLKRLSKGPHLLQLEGVDKGTYGLTVDFVSIEPK